ncbi:recombination-associated protein RdgC [Vibrio metschnikovii]|nr:recombination-associated protein RdgC [Vibrio metschnikovii]
MHFETYSNALIYSFKTLPHQLNQLDELQSDLSKRKWTPIESKSSHSAGFQHPFGVEDSDDLFVKFDCYIHLSYVSEQKEIDDATVDARVNEAKDKLVEQGRDINDEIENDLREQFVRELMPYFRVKRRVVKGYVDMKRKLFIVNTKSTELAELMISGLRTALDSFPVSLIRVEFKPCKALEHFIQNNTLPSDIHFYQNGQMQAKSRDKKEDPRSARLTGYEPSDATVIEMIKGMDVIYCDMYTVVASDNDNTYLGFGINSKPDTSRKLNPDLILSNLSLTMGRRYFGEEVPSAVFQCCAYIGVIIDRLVKTFGESKESNVLVGDFKSTLQEIAQIEESVKQMKVNAAEAEEVLIDEIKNFVIVSGRASVSGIQREFKIGFDRASRAMEVLEQMAVVSEPGHNGMRQVLIGEAL